MLTQRTSVGLDVHARSVFGYGLDGVTGEVFKRRLCPDPAEVAGWIGSLPQPVAVAYEAGPTGYGLYRYLTAQQICCQVAAPSKLQRPPGNRVKNDEQDAFQFGPADPAGRHRRGERAERDPRGGPGPLRPQSVDG